LRVDAQYIRLVESERGPLQQLTTMGGGCPSATARCASEAEDEMRDRHRNRVGRWERGERSEGERERERAER